MEEEEGPILNDVYGGVPSMAGDCSAHHTILYYIAPFAYLTGGGRLKVRIDYGCHLSATPKATQTALSPVSYFPLQGRERLSRHYRQILVHHDGLKIEY